MKTNIFCLAAGAASVSAMSAFAAEAARSLPAPEPTVPAPTVVRAEEKPVEVSVTNETVEANAVYRKVRAVFTFTNPNSRDMSHDLEFPVPDGATVCGYALEIGGAMIPGVVTEKEKARVAFESEKAKNVDPGVVEHVKGNVWRTRIFPLHPKTPRKAYVEYIEPIADGVSATVYERDGEDVFVGERGVASAVQQPIAVKIGAFSSGVVLWDASSSAEASAKAWRGRLDYLPESGDWELVVFRNDVESAKCTSRAALLAAVDAVKYDGGTDIARAVEAAGGRPALLFTDEIDTLGIDAPKYESLANVTVASRPDAPVRPVTVRKLAEGEKAPDGVEVRESTLLATAWAADRIKDLSSQADARKDEFLALGRRYGVASPVTSLIVLESLEQYLTHKIEPHASLPFHDEWVRRRAAEDDQIALRKERASHEQALLALWEERVKWWNDPIPPKKTPKSGLFDGLASAVGVGNSRRAAVDGRARAANSGPEEGLAADMEMEVAPVGAAAMPDRMVMREAAAPNRAAAGNSAAPAAKAAPRPGEAGSGGATISVAAWNPKAGYLDAISKASDKYAEYLSQKEKNGTAPAFFMDCAHWFLRNGEKALGVRIMSNMAEFKLDNAAVWRSMGWRLREAGEYDMAVRCFRMALKMRGEEAQSRRDLALVLSERGKANMCASDLSEAMALFKDAAFEVRSRRSGRRSNDRQVSIIALEELNGLIAWCAGQTWAEGAAPAVPELDAAFRRDLPVRVRIVLSWDVDETDIDLHVMEPEGEEAFYGHRRTGSGGFVSEDVTTGYGPEEYLRKEGTGKFKILSNYFASHQTALTGAATVSATVYTDWGTTAEKREILTLRLDKPKEKLFIGEVDFGEAR